MPCVDAASRGGQRGKRGQRSMAGGQDVASFTGQDINLPPEGLSLLRLYLHQLLKPLNLLLVHTASVILEMSALDTHKHVCERTQQKENIHARSSIVANAT